MEYIASPLQANAKNASHKVDFIFNDEGLNQISWLNNWMRTMHVFYKKSNIVER